MTNLPTATPNSVSTSADVAFERAVCCAYVSNLLPMNCANRDEEQRRNVGLKDLFKSRRAAFDHNKVVAADTAASTPTRKSRQAERLYDF